MSRPTLPFGRGIPVGHGKATRCLSSDHGTAPRKLLARPMRAGSGILDVATVAGRAAVTRAAATNPLKFLIPRRPGQAAWIYSSTYGGGLVAGDEIDIQLRVGPGAVCVMNTQSSNKVYKSPAGLVCRHRLRAQVERDALLILAPDQVTCFAQACYEQDQQVDLHADGALVAVDWLTSGRLSRGERWAFSRYRSRFDVFLDGEQLLSDSLLLDPADGPLDSAFRLGRFNCLAMVVLAGAQVKSAADELLARVGSQPVGRSNTSAGSVAIVAAASPIPHGAVVRILGETSESVALYLRSALGFLQNCLGDSLWGRKW